MKNEQNDKLIASIKKALPERINMAKYLMDLLSLGREAVYRRIRGDVSFDLEELSLITKDLNISIDDILGKKNSTSLFSIDVIQSDKLLDQYCDFLDFYADIFRKMKGYPDSQAQAAYNELPFSFFLSYENLSKFYLYKWIYQVQTLRPSIPFSEFYLPQKVLSMNKKYIIESRFGCHTTSIWSRSIFRSVINTISFFRNIDLLTQEDINLLKQELLSLLDELESMAISGVWKNDFKFHFYISNVDFDASYTYLQCPEFEMSMIRAFSINVVRSSEPEICKTHKMWIDSLKRYSTLISQSGDMYRTQFFSKQRKLINDML